MTTELTQKLESIISGHSINEDDADWLRALTQRPAAQTEREAFEAEMRCEETWGHRSLKKRPDGRYQNWQVDVMWDVWQRRASLTAPQQATPASAPQSLLMRLAGIAAECSDPDTTDALDALIAATQQATPEPLTLGPLAKRNIYDAIRGAYDLGYNDARNARTVPGDSAPGYDGRSVEEDHGGALFNLLSKRLTPATPEPVGEPFGWWFTEDPEVFSMPGSGFRRYPNKPQHTVECIPLYTRPAPGVPEGLIEYLRHVRDTFDSGPMSHVPEVRGQIIALDVWISALAAAQAK